MEKLLNKITSGRFVLTVLVGIAFVYTVVEKTIPSEAAVGIFVMVIQGYFSKKRGGSDV